MNKIVKILLLVIIIFSSIGLVYRYSKTDQIMVELPALPPKLEYEITKIKIADKINRGETLSDLLTKNGITQHQIYPVIEYPVL